MKSFSDEELVKLTLAGDQEAFGELVNRYNKQIYSLAYRLTNNVADAQDLGQEAFVKIYQNLAKYEQDRDFFPWMYKVATNVFYSILRRNSLKTVSTDEVAELEEREADWEMQPEKVAEVKADRKILEQALAELPEKYRVPIVLRYLEDLSYQQIAEIMDLPVSTIETRLYRAKGLLQKIIGNKR